MRYDGCMQRRGRRSGWIVRIVAIAGLTAALAAWQQRDELLRAWLERRLNRAAPESLAGSIRIGRARLTRELRLALDDARATIRASERRIPLRIDHLESLAPVTALLHDQPFPMTFEGIRIDGSRRAGITGIAQFRRGPPWQLEAQARVVRIGLEELTWLSPAYLDGSTGELSGELALRLGEATEPYAELILSGGSEGGRLRARLFDLLVPYLPSGKELRRIASDTGLVTYREASLQLKLAQSDAMRIVLHIRVPEYNLELNLNVDVRVDERRVLGQLTDLLGLIRSR